MPNYNIVSTDTWSLSVPIDWTEKVQDESVAVYFESADGTKALYLSTWRPRSDTPSSPNAVAESIQATSLRALRDMDGYSWKTMYSNSTHSEGTVILTCDSFDQGNSYHICETILSSPAIVVRLTCHNYACDDYEVSRKYFAPMIDSLCIL
jgi:hypothetical protein